MKIKKFFRKLYVKSKYSKKSQGGIITTVLIILLCLAAIIILWNLLMPILQNTQQQTNIKQEAAGTQMSIDKVSSDLSPATGIINITLTRGGGEMTFLNQTQKTYNVTRQIENTTYVPHNYTIIVNGSLDIVFAIDTTGSMSTDIAAVKNIVQNFTITLAQKNITYRLGLVDFEDYPVSPCGGSSGKGLDYPSKIYTYREGNFTTNLTEFNDSLFNLSLGSGGDDPEADYTGVDNATDLGFNATKRIIILITDSPPHAQDCLTSSGANTSATCYLGPQYILSGPGSMLNKLLSKNISLYYLNKNGRTCYNGADINLSNLTGGQFFNYSSSSASVDIQNELMNISYQMNMSNITIETNYTTETTYENVTETYYEPVQNWQSLRVIVYNATSSHVFNMPKDTPILLPMETRDYAIETGGLTNINKIEVYIIIQTSGGNEDSELIAVWNS